jgi:hypothetical protein
MSIPIKKCRKLLGDIGEKMSDEEIKSMQDICVVIADLAIDTYLSKKSANKSSKEIYFANNTYRQ